MSRIHFHFRGQDCTAIRHPNETPAEAVARSIQRRESGIHGVTMRLDSTAANGNYALYEARLDGAADKSGARLFRNVWVTIYR